MVSRTIKDAWTPYGILSHVGRIIVHDKKKKNRTHIESTFGMTEKFCDDPCCLTIVFRCFASCSTVCNFVVFFFTSWKITHNSSSTILVPWYAKTTHLDNTTLVSIVSHLFATHLSLSCSYFPLFLLLGVSDWFCR